MTSGKRVMSILSLCCISILSLSSAGRGDVDLLVAYTISGNVGLPGVRLEGLPKPVVSDESGHYSAYVTAVWFGTVTPIKEGYTFTPPSRTYTNVNADLTDNDYTPTVRQLTISGDVGLPGVRLNGLPRSVASDASGRYVAKVEYGWAGEITPSKSGYTFDPPSRAYFGVVQDSTGDDYFPHELMYTISGDVGMPGVSLEGLPGAVLSDESGRYSADVPFGWAGAVTPKKASYYFEPATRTYDHVATNRDNQDYAAGIRTLTISDVISLAGRAIPNVSVMADPPVDQALTDASGRYVIEVPYGWTGRLILSRPGYVFNPSVIAFNNITTNIVDGQNIPASEPLPVSVTDSAVVRPQVGLAGDTSAVLFIAAEPFSPVVMGQIKEDMGIMLQILRDKLSEPRTILGTLYNFGDFFDSDGGTEAFYLHGYGAVFVMKVGFSLMPAGSSAGAQSEQPGDPVWQRARQRMYNAPGPGTGSRTTPTLSDPESFRRFKEEMIGMLKHAANIRHLPPDESVVLTLVSRADQSAPGYGQEFHSSYGGNMYYGGELYGGGSFSASGSFSSYGQSGSSSASGPYSPGYETTSPRGVYGGASSSGQMGAYGAPGRLPSQVGVGNPVPVAASVLTFQALKADIDAFAQGEMTFEEFSGKVKVAGY